MARPTKREALERDARQLARAWRAGEHSYVLRTFTSADRASAFAAYLASCLCDGLDQGHRADFLAGLAARVQEVARDGSA